MNKVKLQSSDNEIIEVELEVANGFGTIKSMLDLGLPGEAGTSDVVPVPAVNAAILRKVIEYAEHYKEKLIVKEVEDKHNQSLPSWDVEFLKVDQWTLREIIMAANYLDFRRLLRSGCKTVAKMIKGKTPDQLRQEFNIENDLVDEE